MKDAKASQVATSLKYSDDLTIIVSNSMEFETRLVKWPLYFNGK